MKILRNPKFIGKLAYWGLRALTATLKLSIHKSRHIDAKTPYLFAFWHGQQFLPAQVVVSQHHTPKCVMVSPSRDGTILATLLEAIGYEIIRGSSRDGNIRALIGMKAKLEAGYSIGFGIDGPIGPIYVVKPGIAFLAQKCRVKIIPMGSAFNRAWIFDKAWDKFQLPKPFAKGSIFLGEPFAIDAADTIEAACLEIARRVDAADQQARELLK